MNLNDLFEMKDSRDAYERDVDNSTGGFGKDSQAYRADGGANDENHSLDQQSSTWYIRLNGKLIKDKSGNPYSFQDKAAANKAAMAMQAKLFNKDKEFMLTTNPNDKVAEDSQRVDSIVTDALKIMRGAGLNDAVQALKTVLGDREYNDRRGYYNFYVRQLMDMYGQQGVAEAGYIGGHNRDEPDYSGIDTVPERIKVKKGSRIMAIPPSALEQFKADGWTEVDQDVAETLGDLRPKLGSTRDQGKSVRKWRKDRGMDESRVSEAQQLNVQQLATISDAALDKAYGYGRSQPGNSFGWQANLKSASFAKQMIDKGVTDIEAISDAIHKGWNTTAQAFVQNPEQFDDTAKLKAAGKLEAKLQQRAQLMKQNYGQLPEEEKDKDRVVARALLQALKGEQDMAEGHTEVKDKQGKVVSWKDDSEWHPVEKNKQGQPKDPRGVVTHLSDVARRKTADQQGMDEAEVDSDGHSVDHADSGEYDYEGDQARDQMNTIVRAARRLDGLLDDNENMPEWVQMKVTLAADYLDTAADYIESNQEPELAEGERGRGRPPSNTQDTTPVTPGRVEKTATGIRHHADASRYGGTEPDAEDDYLMSKSHISRLGKMTEPDIDEGNRKPEPPEADYGDDYQQMVLRLKKLAGAGPLKTVYHPASRVYRNVPVAVQPKK